MPECVNNEASGVLDPAFQMNTQSQDDILIHLLHFSEPQVLEFSLQDSGHEEKKIYVHTKAKLYLSAIMCRKGKIRIFKCA